MSKNEPLTAKELLQVVYACSHNENLTSCKDCPFNTYGWNYCQNNLLRCVYEAFAKEEKT